MRDTCPLCSHPARPEDFVRGLEPAQNYYKPPQPIAAPENMTQAKGMSRHHCPVNDRSEVLDLSREVFSRSYQLAVDDEEAPVRPSQDASGGQPDISCEVLMQQSTEPENTLRNQRTVPPVSKRVSTRRPFGASVALNAISPYYTMFPRAFPIPVLERFGGKKLRVFDPFCGRGTTKSCGDNER